MKTVIFATDHDKTIGLQFRRRIEADVLFIFPDIGPSTVFHSENVPEPFDICFLDPLGRVLSVHLLMPPHDLVQAPPGTASAFESKAGSLARWGIVQGSVVSVSP